MFIKTLLTDERIIKNMKFNMMNFQKKTDMYKLKPTALEDLYEYLPESDYLVNHQLGIWNREYMMSVLEPGESPWTNEIEGTKRVRLNFQGGLFLYDYDWFDNVCRKGKLTELGEQRKIETSLS